MAEHPNILMIISDQHAHQVMANSGNPYIRTPNMDALAARGVTFDNTYCAAPLCVPSRMTMLTARHCSEIDVWTNSCYLRSDIPTFMHSLGAGGYDTILGGRMHFIGPDQLHGYHERIVGDIGSYTHPGAGRGPNFVNIDRAGCGQSGACVRVAGPGHSNYKAYDDLVLEACSEWLLERGAGQQEHPFLLTAGFLLPHCPFIAPKELYDYYYENLPLPEMPEGYLENLPEPMKKWRETREVEDLTEEEIRRARAGYYGLVEYFDGIVGRLLETLHESGMADDTVVVYTSDHGEGGGENGLWWKSNFYEHSTKVPMIWSGPGLPEGERRDEVVSLLDLGPTLCDVTGSPEMREVSGRSLLGLLQDSGELASASEACAKPAGAGGSEATPAGGRGGQGWPNEAIAELVDLGGYIPGRMIRRGAWKLIHYEGYAPMLFNLDEDPGEFVDRAGDPTCRDIRNLLHDRVRWGWDPHRALKELERARRDRGSIGQWGRAWRGAPVDDPNHCATPDDAVIWDG